MKKLYTALELADYLSVEKQTIYNWLTKGKITGIKLGRMWRFDPRKINSWLRNNNAKQRSI